MDWVESPTAHFLEINVQGLSKDDIKVQIKEGNILQIKGEGGKEKPHEKDATWFVVERGTGKRGFSQEIELPKYVNVAQIKG
ncbi:hypothetical protein I3760_03G118900 [Carya illinoinensis]|nr:hypothetical protein I3760_03G118900 [Carya illinoinensis]